MCGIIASRGVNAGRITLDGLRSLEYRGYDSAGVAVLTQDGVLRAERAVGRLERLLDIVGEDDAVLDATTAIGHTRWATHGAVNLSNCHPVTDCTGRVAVVHNGVLENAEELRSELTLLGHRFTGDIDSEVIAHLLEDELDADIAPFDAMRKVVARLRGSWAIAAIVAGHDGIVLAKHGAPLLVRGDENRVVVASDAPATADSAGPLRALSDGDVVELGASWQWSGAGGADALPPPLAHRFTSTPRPAKPAARTARSALRPEDPQRTSHDHAMAREIAEQSEIAGRLVEEILANRTTAAGWYEFGLKVPRRVHIIACGSSYYAALVIARTLRSLAHVHSEVSVAGEYVGHGGQDSVYAGYAPDPGAELMIAISQSGETADILRALDGNSSPLIAITNSPWSSLALRADVVLDCAAGVERGVAATKSFTAQVIVGVGLALALAHANGRHEVAERARAALRVLPGQLARADAHTVGRLHPLLEQLADQSGWLFLGAGTGLPYAAEGALKLKEVTYRWAQSYPASEIKHGPLALVEAGTPVVVIDNGLPRLELSIAEVASRGARVIRVGGLHSDIGPALVGDDPPWGPLAAVVPLQHLARELGLLLHRDVDHPRNLAKSVTVV